MSPRTEKQFEEIREERKAQIKDVALAVIFEEGAQNTSISKIAKRAGISKGLLYNYYESKEELILEIIYDGIAKVIKPFDPDSDGILTREEAIYFIDELFEILRSNLKYWRLYFSVMLQPKVMALIKDKLFDELMPYIGMIVNYFEKKGSDNPMVDAKMIMAMLDGLCFNFVIDPKHFPLEDIKKRFYAFI
jgi:AcrR family transcriptional regulator